MSMILPCCRHRRKISIFFFIFIFLDTDPHLASVVCVPLSLFRFEIRVVCVWELVYVCAYERNLESPPTMGNSKV
jgi:hypothetical protein